MPLPFIAALLAGAASSAAAVGTAVTAAGAAAAGAAASAGAAVAGAAAAGVAAVGAGAAGVSALVAAVTISSGMLVLIASAVAVLAIGFTIYHLIKLEEERTRGFKDGQVAASKEYEAKFKKQGEEFKKFISDSEKYRKMTFDDKKELMTNIFYFYGKLEGYCEKNKVTDKDLIDILAFIKKVVEDFRKEVKSRNA